MTSSASTRAAIALNRFGLGARPDEPVPADPTQWLLDQFGRYDPRPATLAVLGDGQQLSHAYRTAERERRQMKQAVAAPAADAMASRGLAATPPVTPTPAMAPDAADPVKVVRGEIRDRYRAAINARLQTALATDTPFPERLVAFWSNHFAVSTEKPEVDILAPDFEAQAIRPNILGRFSDLLLAAERHPAMLLYLDQSNSVGPGSVRAVRASQAHPGKPAGLNENLAREAMELHTLGVRTGYTQADVTEFARALTGWSVAGLGAASDDAVPIAFQYRANFHEPGTRTIVGRGYDQPGEDQARAVLLDLAASPATARHVATKLARHFVADGPPPALVDRLTATYLSSGGDLPAVYRTLVTAPEAWAQPLPKFKNPWDWSVSALRGLGRRDLGHIDGAPMLTQLGQTIWKPGQPVGYDDIGAAWAAPDALMRRVEVAQRLAATFGPEIDARALAPRLLPGTLGPATITAIGQAESGPTALALLLVSPEFQRR